MPGHSYFEQGMGLLRPHATAAAMAAFTPHVSAIPPRLDLAADPCDYFWPLCAQPLYAACPPQLNYIAFASPSAPAATSVAVASTPASTCRAGTTARSRCSPT